MITLPAKVGGTIVAAGSRVAIDTTQCGTVGIKITGTFSSTLTFEGTIDGVNWDLVPANTVAASPTTVTGATAPGVWQVNCTGFKQISVNCPTTYVSGTVVVSLSGSLSSPGGGGSGGGGGGGGGGPATIADGADVTQGAIADASVAAGAAGTISAKLRRLSADIGTLIAGGVSFVLGAGTALIGKVGIDQTTPGTTNAISQSQQKSASFTLQNGATANGNGTAATTDGYNGGQQLLVANGAGTCTITVEGSFDNFATAQNVQTVGVQLLSSGANPGPGSTNVNRTTLSGVISVGANTTYVYGLLETYPYVRAVISSASGLGAGTSLTGCTASLYCLPG